MFLYFISGGGVYLAEIRRRSWIDEGVVGKKSVGLQWAIG
jgi:hypothetical protein